MEMSNDYIKNILKRTPHHQSPLPVHYKCLFLVPLAINPNEFISIQSISTIRFVKTGKHLQKAHAVASTMPQPIHGFGLRF
jgi:hypothetical protein